MTLVSVRQTVTSSSRRPGQGWDYPSATDRRRNHGKTLVEFARVLTARVRMTEVKSVYCFSCHSLNSSTTPPCHNETPAQYAARAIICAPTGAGSEEVYCEKTLDRMGDKHNLPVALVRKNRFVDISTLTIVAVRGRARCFPRCEDPGRAGAVPTPHGAAHCNGRWQPE
jgi:hypothetical protein